MKIKLLMAILTVSIPLIAGLSQDASALVIDNDIPSGTLGHWSVDVEDAGESRAADVSANRFVSADTFTEDVLFDYFTYIDLGTPGAQVGAFQLSGSAPALTGDDEVTSSGSFVGSGGNTIDWTAVSSIGNGDSRMITTYTFTAQTGSLGNIRLYQYLDEDIEAVSDCVFFTRGSIGTNDLELFTMDNLEVYGVSHSGALDAGGGLVNSVFAGYAAHQFNNIKPALTGGTQPISLTGTINPILLPFIHPQLGTVYGPLDIVSVMAWDVNPAATTATIITTLGGVPDFMDLPPEAGEIGGEILSINTTLLVAGAIGNSLWIVPVVAGTFGIAAVYLKTRKN